MRLEVYDYHTDSNPAFSEIVNPRKAVDTILGVNPDSYYDVCCEYANGDTVSDMYVGSGLEDLIPEVRSLAKIIIRDVTRRENL